MKLLSEVKKKYKKYFKAKPYILNHLKSLTKL